MFRIRRVHDDITPANKEAIAQVQEILRTQFPLLSRWDVTKLPEQLRNPLKYRFRSILFVAEGSKGRIIGFALLFHEPALKFCYLDYISAAERRTGGGIGGALYERVREEALDLNSIGLFFECLPDDPKLSKDPLIRKQNAARLRFYERYGARPIINTAYETPLNPGDDNPPYLVYDGLGQDDGLPLDIAREIVRAVLERKYKGVCPPSYVEMVVESCVSGSRGILRRHPSRPAGPYRLTSRLCSSSMTVTSSTMSKSWAT
jgi:GNAT superfamily N-acetyltransferase